MKHPPQRPPTRPTVWGVKSGVDGDGRTVWRWSYYVPLPELAARGTCATWERAYELALHWTQWVDEPPGLA